MKTVSAYLNFKKETEEAFSFYKNVFRTEYAEEIMRFGDVPPEEEMPPLSDEEKNLVMHVGLTLFDGYILRGSDTPDSFGQAVKFGNNMHIHIEVDTKEETDRLFNALKEGGQIGMELAEQFWGDYFGNLTDKFGVQWMISCPLR